MMSSNNLIKVFVYGTLKRGEPNHFWLTNQNNGYSKFLGIGQTIKKFPLIIATKYNIPFLLDKPNTGHHINGEVYEVDAPMLANLDILEDYPKFYDREVQKVQLNNEIIHCWCYLIRTFPDKLLELSYLDTYHDSPNKKYCEISNRDSTTPVTDKSYWN